MNTHWISFLGRLHPLILHLPIGLFTAVLLLEIQSWFMRESSPRSSHPCLKLLYVAAALSACATAATGYLLSRDEAYAGTVLDSHFRFALLFTIAAAMTTLLAVLPGTGKARGAGRAIPRFLMLLLSLGLMTMTSHRGAVITHGSAFLSEHAPAWLQPILGSVEDESGRPTSSVATVYNRLVKPVLSSRCLNCHGVEKKLNGLALHTPEAIQTGGKSGSPVSSVNNAKPLLTRYINLPPEDEHHMPPNGKPQLTDAEKLLLEWWIEAGASFELPTTDPSVPLQFRRQPEAATDPTDVLQRDTPPPKSVMQAIASLRSQRVFVQTLGEHDDALHVDCSVEAGTVDNAFIGHLEPVATKVAWLNLSRCNISSDAMTTVARMANLEELNLSGTGVDVGGLPALKELEKLVKLNLCNTSLNDAAAADLGQMTQLRELYLWNSGISEKAIDQLRKDLPSTRITDDLALIAPQPK
jgi:uncharacterized membrane protein